MVASCGLACRQAQIWNDSGPPPVRIAVNVSATELRASGFVLGVRNVLRETGLEPNCLELELTETFLVQDAHSAAAVLQALKDLGVRLSLDDFGTGYSSLSHLKCFPTDTLKIDQSFVRGLVANSADISIVSAVITMRKNLNMRVVAEGVETPEQLSFLQERSCSYGQGVLFSPPLDAGAMGRRLQAQGAGQPCLRVRTDEGGMSSQSSGTGSRPSMSDSAQAHPQAVDLQLDRPVTLAAKLFQLRSDRRELPRRRHSPNRQCCARSWRSNTYRPGGSPERSA